jgi:hypothetical protein
MITRKESVKSSPKVKKFLPILSRYVDNRRIENVRSPIYHE